MKTQTCCFTGHRNIQLDEREAIKDRLEEEMINLIHQGVRYFGAGGALGFDMIAEFSVLELKREYPQIRLILVLPHKDQAKGWDPWDKGAYDFILSRADKVVYVSKRYEPGCMQERNRRLVDSSAVCICYLTNQQSGTAYTVDYARQKGLRIINLV